MSNARDKGDGLFISHFINKPNKWWPFINKQWIRHLSATPSSQLLLLYKYTTILLRKENHFPVEKMGITASIK
jgi:hypothetical protein